MKAAAPARNLARNAGRPSHSQWFVSFGFLRSWGAPDHTIRQPQYLRERGPDDHNAVQAYADRFRLRKKLKPGKTSLDSKGIQFRPLQMESELNDLAS